MARIRGPRKVQRYTAEFKLKAVKLSELRGVLVGKTFSDALDIHPFMLSQNSISLDGENEEHGHPLRASPAAGRV